MSDDAERRRLYEMGDRVFPAFATYRRTATGLHRTIPIVQLRTIDTDLG